MEAVLLIARAFSMEMEMGISVPTEVAMAKAVIVMFDLFKE